MKNSRNEVTHFNIRSVTDVIFNPEAKIMRVQAMKFHSILLIQDTSLLELTPLLGSWNPLALLENL